MPDRRLSGQIRYCDNLELAVLNELVAQLVEQRPFKAWVLGSSPSELTTSFRSPGRYRSGRSAWGTGNASIE